MNGLSGFYVKAQDRTLPGHHNLPAANGIIIKIKNNPIVNLRTTNMTNRAEKLAQLSRTGKFRSIKPFETNLSPAARKTENSILDGIYKLSLKNPGERSHIISWLKSQSWIEYAEPDYNYYPLYVPDDPAAAVTGQQNYLSKIRAYDAWDVEKGDSNVVIGISDTGVDLSHEDLGGNLFHNYNDPVNGVDDDGNGYVDDYTGWDFADSDNDVSADKDAHGTEVTGVASATVDNSLGMAGIGFHSKYLPLKIFRSSDDSFNNGYESLIYAADEGCSVVVLSWGEPGGYSQFGQDVINSLVEERNVVVVAAAGNTPENTYYYPASFHNVLSVGAVDNDDQKTSWATYNDQIDIVAQGAGVYTTTNGSKYILADGSSFAAPQVAAAAALLRAEKPSWNARQIMEQLRVSSDDIYSVGGNSQYDELLGKGRLDIYNALTDTLKPSVRMDDFSYNNGIGSYIFSDDTVDISGNFTDYLARVTNIKITLSSETPLAEVIDSVFDAGNLTTLQTVQNDIPFRVIMSSSLPADSLLKFRLGITGDGYNDYQYFNLRSTPPYFGFSNGTMDLTIADNGNLGYYQDSLISGSGLILKDSTLLDRIGMLITADGREVSDNITSDFKYNIRSKDFTTGSHIRYYRNSIADRDARSSFHEIEELDSPLNVTIDQKVLGWTETGEDSLLIIEYRITNPTADTLFHLKTGLFTDWDLGDKSRDKTDWGPADSTGYTSGSSGNVFAGVTLLTKQKPGFYGIDLGNYNGNAPDFTGSFNDSVKAAMLSGEHVKLSAGNSGNGNDVAQLNWAESDTLLPFTSTKVAFAILAAVNSSSLTRIRQTAKTLYNQYLTNPPVDKTVLICSSDSVQLNAGVGQQFEIYSDPFGNNLISTDSVIFIKNIENDSTIYYDVMNDGIKGEIRRLLIKIDLPKADFKLSSDSLILYDSKPAQLTLTNNSVNAKSYQWDFGNGYAADLPTPVAYYSQAGIYTLSLIAYSNTGCPDSSDQILNVFNASPKPDLKDSVICPGDSLTLNPDNVKDFSIYSDSTLNNLIFQGDSYSTGSLSHDTVFYLTGNDSLFVSKPQKITISVSAVSATFSWVPDTSLFTSKYILDLTAASAGMVHYYWKINNVGYSYQKDTVYNYQGLTKFKVSLLTVNNNDCADSSSAEIVPQTSPDVKAVKLYSCKGDNIMYNPSDAGIIAVFRDSTGLDLIEKGQDVSIPELKSDSTFYIASIDSLIVGKIVPVNLMISSPVAAFIINPDTLNITEEDSVMFTDVSLGETSRQWDFELNGQDTLPDPVEYYYDPGNYEVNLKVTDSLGCSADTTGYLAVVSVNALTPVEKSGITIYPNPARKAVILEGNSISYIRDIRLYTLSGRLIEEKLLDTNDFIKNQKIKINFPTVNPGYYILNLISKKGIISDKIIIY